MSDEIASLLLVLVAWLGLKRLTWSALSAGYQYLAIGQA